MTNQEKRLADFKQISGKTAGTYNEISRAAFEVMADIPSNATYNEAFILWLQSVTGSEKTNINELAALYADHIGYDNWNAVANIAPIRSSLHSWHRFSSVTLSGNNVSSWSDLISNNYDFSQGTAANQPLGITNGVRGDKTDDYLQASAGDFDLTHDDSPWSMYIKLRILEDMENDLGTIFASAVLNNDKGIKILYDDRAANSADNMVRFIWGNGSSQLLNTLSSTGFVRGAVQVLSIHYNGTTLKVLIDDTEVLSTGLGGTPATGNSDIPACLFSIEGVNPCACKIYEMAVYDEYIDPAGSDHDRVYGYFSNIAVADDIDDVAQVSLWLNSKSDASVSDTGGLVDTWSDLSINANNATAATTDRPTYSSSNGTIEYIPADRMALTNRVNEWHQGPSTLFAVTNHDTGDGGESAIFDTAGQGLDATGDEGMRFTVDADNDRYNVRAGNGGALSVALTGTNSSYTMGSLNLACMVLNDAAATDVLVYDLASGGTILSGNKAAALGTGNSQAANPKIGALDGGFYFFQFNGFINELILFPSALSLADINTVAGILGDRWGVSTITIT